MKTQCTGEQLEFHALGRRSVKWAVLAVAVFLCAVALFAAVPRPVMLGVRVPTRSLWKYTVKDRPPASPRRVSARDAIHRVGYGSVRGKRALWSVSLLPWKATTSMVNSRQIKYRKQDSTDSP